MNPRIISKYCFLLFGVLMISWALFDIARKEKLSDLVEKKLRGESMPYEAKKEATKFLRKLYLAIVALGIAAMIENIFEI